MKSSTILAACGALLVTASPILQERRLFVKTDVVVEWVTVTVTEGDTSTVFRRPNHVKPTTTTTSSAAPSSTSQAPPPPPPPSSSSSLEPAVQPTPEPSPEPSPEPTPEPAPVAAPIVEAAQPSSEAAEAPAPTEQAPAAQPSDYQSTALYHHNIHRFNHSADALTWDDGLASSAEILAKRCVFEHDTSINGGGYGQNLAMWGSSGDPESFGAAGSVARAASDGWYNNELYLFPQDDFGKDTPDMSNFMQWGHFSQLVWINTKKVGCATHFCAPDTLSKLGSWYTVCNYSPPGNVGGAYGENVKRPLGQPRVAAPA
ncbi:PR-1-like protein [Parathielavia appendiculata]|uniref:PR-1-like protein n=1 Tax=Parathielavia appendiculata TaxID=2587402 RepID=A0AAN6U1U4_9PEZI|nr:PR-1-like protein [Parathielavia appendiculata]